MSLIDKLREDMFKASKEGRSFESDILKMAIASVKNEEVKKGESLNDSEVEKILRTEVKKIKDSISQYEDMGRSDLVEEEERQLEVLEKYLPKLMSEEDIKKIVEQKASQLNISSVNEMGKLMGAVMGELNGKADGAVVKQVVQDFLS
jgi:hypothetical protein